MKDPTVTLLTVLAAFLLGAICGAFTSWIAPIQDAYLDGRNSVLLDQVTVGSPECGYVKVPLSVLADMVSAGIMDWHLLCQRDEP